MSKSGGHGIPAPKGQNETAQGASPGSTFFSVVRALKGRKLFTLDRQHLWKCLSTVEMNEMHRGRFQFRPFRAKKALYT